MCAFQNLLILVNKRYLPSVIQAQKSFKADSLHCINQDNVYHLDVQPDPYNMSKNVKQSERTKIL